MKEPVEQYELWHHTKHGHARLGRGTLAHLEVLASMIDHHDWPDLYLVGSDGEEKPFL